MSMQEQIKAWLATAKQKIADMPPEQTGISIPLLQGWLACSYSQALMIRDALIKEGVISSVVNGIQYDFTPAYMKEMPTPPAPSVAEETAVKEATAETVEKVDATETTQAASSEETAPPASPATTEKPTPPAKPVVDRDPLPPQQTVSLYPQAQLDKYKDAAAVDTFCMHIWQNMLMHLCVKGFNSITEKYLPMLTEKNVLPPSLFAYLQAHPLTAQTPVLPMCAEDLQTSLQEFGLFATIELIKDDKEITRIKAIETIGERIKALRNTFLLSSVAIDSYQALRSALRNSSDEMFEQFKASI